MKPVAAVLFFLLAVAPAHAVQTGGVIDKVLGMIDDLAAKTIKEGEEAQKTYEEFAEFCEERSKELMREIKAGQQSAKDLTATIDKAEADTEDANTKIEAASTAMKKAEDELKEADSIRKKGAKDFAATEKDLTSTISALERAITIVEKESGSASSLVQIKNAGSVAQAMKLMVEAASISVSDANRLTALVQSESSEMSKEDSDSDSGSGSGSDSGDDLDPSQDNSDEDDN
eukprot:gnl/TRDRNA2_/TRDRNA2_177502_c7_seq8.p2 gnl/TRDRNA2_/TRDRNA2_177502_c7~~gnl/TRDRNA2_/TRDRNA2_177502_c7_seq8.p2  ORF type:complete len:231 (+),score=89.01 gnl/TRDRNA2_/TRDRNA2_177502_c7_seq8:78-770(+)